MTTVNAIRKKRKQINRDIAFQFDYWLVVALVGLVIVGLMMVYSTTFDLGIRGEGIDAEYYFGRQLAALGIGVVVSLIIFQFDYHVFRRFSVVFLLGILLLLLVVLLFGEAILGARRGLYQGSFQPSEVAKLAMVLYIADWLSSKGERVKDLNYGLIPFSLIVGIVCALIVLQPDLGTAALIAIVAFTLFFLAGADLRQFAIAGALGGTVFLILVTMFAHASARLESFITGFSDPVNAGWHMQQIVIAFGVGGLSGVGLGNSTQKFGALPAAHTDGVFAIVGEELGLIGCLLVIGLFVLFTWRGIRVAMQARDGYGSMLALGITLWLSIQAIINFAVVTALMPFTGMPLPFLSYGGSSMAISVVAVAILLSISRDSALKKRVQSSKPIRDSIRESFDLRRRNRRAHLSRTSRSR